MTLTYDWLVKKVKYDLKNNDGKKTVYVLINEEGFFSDYFMDVDKIPSPYELK